MLEWMILGRQILESSNVEKGFVARSSKSDFEKLCSLEVLGLTDEGNNV